MFSGKMKDTEQNRDIFPPVISPFYWKIEMRVLGNVSSGCVENFSCREVRRILRSAPADQAISRVQGAGEEQETVRDELLGKTSRHPALPLHSPPYLFSQYSTSWLVIVS